ncbi:B-cell receptor CD22-like isoform X3 [Denticeps clupeoides]|uniref:B-cell receptor CD22-like isoform X3 n=1 Tax=Denticeps clupeoides TaxID=299321 RepID=UPI0010A58E4A|nr:cell adhesion molecule 4 isoform X3 [Denticeps clupeoides]
MTTYSPTLNLGLLSLLSASLMLTCHCGTVPLPQSVQAVEGSCVLVPCHTESHTRVIWYMYHIRTWPKVYDVKDRANVIDQFRERTSVPGSADKGNCTLMIKNVQRSDNEVSLYVNTNPDTEGRQYDPERLVKIFVQTRHSPVIDARPSQVEGGDVLLSCSILHSCPPSPPAFQWKGLSADTGSVSTQEERIGVWRTIATAAVKATPEHNGKAVRCVTTVSSGFREMSRSVMLNIPYAPTALKVLVEKAAVKEGDSVTLICDVNSNPTPTLYMWNIINGGEVSEQKSTEKSLSVNDVSRSISLTCAARNSIGWGRSARLTLDVDFAPSILPNSSCTERGGILKCVCLAQSRPEASITWLMDGNQSFTLDSTQKGEVKSATLTGTIKLTPNVNVSCTAVNTHGTATLVMPVWPHQTTQTWIGTGSSSSSSSSKCDEKKSLSNLPLFLSLIRVSMDYSVSVWSNSPGFCDMSVHQAEEKENSQGFHQCTRYVGNPSKEEHDFNNIYLNA